MSESKFIVYDGVTDDMVPLTQKHLDHLTNCTRALGQMHASFEKIKQVMLEFKEKSAEIEERHKKVS